MRITNVISDIGGGGAQSVMVQLSNLWVADGKEVQVVVRSFYKPPVHKFVLDPTVGISTVIGSEVGKRWPPRTKKIGALLALRTAIRKTHPDVVIAYMDTTAVDTLLATISTGIPIIVAEHCDPNTRPVGAMSVESPSAGTIRNVQAYIYGKLRQWFYPRAAAVVCLTETAMSFFSPEIRAKGCVIPNPVLPPHSTPAALPTFPANRRVVYIGRLSTVKGLDRLLRAYAKIIPHHDGWQLELWGEGSEQDRLVELTKRLDISDRVSFAGWTYDACSVLQGADLFVMSSHTEGFPVALCEAMACGVPPVSFDCPSGPRHIIRHGIDGLLVPNNDIDALAAAMDHLMSNEVERTRLASRAPEVLERFGTDKVLTLWEELLRRVTTSKLRAKQ